MRLSNFGYLCKEGVRNIFSNRLMSFACIGVLVACLLLIGSSVLITLNVNQVVGVVEEQNEIIAYIKEGATADDVQLLDLELGAIDNIIHSRYITNDETLESLRIQIGGDAVLFEGLVGKENPLLNRYILRLDDLSIMESTVAEIEQLENIHKVASHPEVASILTGIKRVVAVAGAGIVLILVVVTVVIITNTIKLTVYSRRREINIMKYVGATDTFIRLPFLVEGMVIGLVAALISFFILGLGYTYLLKWVGENFSTYVSIVVVNAINFRDIALYVLGGFAALGMFIGVSGSGMFVRKYLRV